MIGTWFTIPHIMVAELVAQGGFDFLLLDGEHAPVPPDAISYLLPATELYSAPVIYRVRTNAVDLIRGALDAGASGVMVPMIETVTDARNALNAAKYPPLGKRGIGPWRASNYYENFLDYVAEANDKTCVILQIESAAAVEAIENIASLEGIDVLYVGPADLAATMGLTIGASHPALTEAIERIATVARKHRKALGIDATTIELFSRSQAMGFTFFTYSVDTTYILEGARAASTQLRALMSRR